jgi:hypothetical protein
VDEQEQETEEQEQELDAFQEVVESMRGVVATVTSCIGGKDEKFAVQVRPAAPRPQYFVYKTLGDFDALWASLEAMAADVKRRQQQLEDARFGSAASKAAAAESKPQSLSLMAKWLASVVDHYAFRQAVQQLREQDKEAMSALNVLLQCLVPRVSALYVENTILRCGCCRVTRQLAKLVRKFLEVEAAPGSPSDAERKLLRKRQFAEMRPEDSDRSSSSTVDSEESLGSSPAGGKRANTGLSLFPARNAADRSPKAQKLGSASELCLPQMRKVGLAGPGMSMGMSMGMSAPLPGRRRVFAEVDF